MVLQCRRTLVKDKNSSTSLHGSRPLCCSHLSGRLLSSFRFVGQLYRQRQPVTLAEILIHLSGWLLVGAATENPGQSPQRRCSPPARLSAPRCRLQPWRERRPRCYSCLRGVKKPPATDMSGQPKVAQMIAFCGARNYRSDPYSTVSAPSLLGGINARWWPLEQNGRKRGYAVPAVATLGVLPAARRR